LTGEDYEGYIKEKRGDESLLLGQWTYLQHPRHDTENRFDLPFLDYTAIFVKVPPFYDLCKNHFIKDQEEDYELFGQKYEPIDETLWGAREAYQIHDTELGYTQDYLICYDNLILELELSFEPTKEQILIIKDKLTK